MTHVVFATGVRSQGGLSSLVFLGLMVVVFYLFIIRPQRKRSKEQQALAESLGPGQEVRTIGGIHGRVVSVDDDSVVLAVEEGKIRVSRRAIGTRVGEDAT